MPQTENFVVGESSAFACLCISWLLEEESTIAQPLRGKLTVPSGELISALVGLTAVERLELKDSISQRSTHGPLPGPLSGKALCAFLDAIAIT